MTEKFTPNKGDYIRVQGNKQYLPVPQRVQWMRGEHPDWGIHTQIYVLDWEAGYVIMRADVVDAGGHILGQGTKTETRKGFGDFVEKAETGAVGRALARAGYGTEDALDLEGDRYADAPIQASEQGRGPARAASSPRASAPAQYRRGELSELMAAHSLDLAAVEQLALVIGIPKAERPMSNESMDRLIEAIESPSGVPAASEDDAGGAPPSPPASEPTTRTVEEAIADAEAKAKKAKVPA